MALSLILPESGPAGGGRGTAAAGDDDGTTGGSRSMVYALLVAGFWRADALGGIAVVHLAILLLTLSWVIEHGQKLNEAEKLTI